MARATAADRVAEEVTIRLERLATLTADAILQSLYRPQVADPTSDQALDYWERVLVPNGQFDPAARDRVVQQIGAPEYKAVAQALARRQRKDDREAAAQTPASPPAEAAPVEGTPPAPAAAPEPAVPPLDGPRTQPAA